MTIMVFMHLVNNVDDMCDHNEDNYNCVDTLFFFNYNSNNNTLCI